MKTFTIALRATIVTLGVNGTYLSIRHDRTRSSAFPMARQRQPGYGRKRPGRRLRVDCPGILRIPPTFSRGRRRQGRRAMTRLLQAAPTSVRHRRSCRIASKTILNGLKAENPEATGPVPAELVTTSGSGLDPHLSPEAHALASAASCQSARRSSRAGEGRRRCQCRRKNIRHLGRTASQRADGQSGARSPDLADRAGCRLSIRKKQANRTKTAIRLFSRSIFAEARRAELQ